VHKICMQYEGRGAQKFVQLLRYWVLWKNLKSGEL
jgi:hypothetical protein